MNVNGARFHLLLGRADWARCTGVDGLPLAAWWDMALSPMPEAPATLPEFDPQRQELSLRAQAIALPATVGETRLTLDARRAAAADRHGNLYRIADDASALLAISAGSGSESAFWPDSTGDCFEQRAQERPTFTDAPQPSGVEAPLRLLALAVTEDDYLVVAFTRGAVHGLLSFDLIGGGAPQETAWPPGLAITPFALAPRSGGGLWLLDRSQRRLWELDCTLALIDSGQPMQTVAPEDADQNVDDFGPPDGAPRVHARREAPAGLDLAAAPLSMRDTIAIQPLGTDAVLVLDRDDAQQRARVLRLRRRGETWDADASAWLDALPAPAHDMVLAAGLSQDSGPPPQRLFITTAVGNQAHAFSVIDDASGFALRAPTELYPLRRYAGRALPAVQGNATYDSGPTRPQWMRIVRQHRNRYAEEAVLITPLLDSDAPGTVWDKLLLDACIPADTEIRIESRASDEWVLDAASPLGAPQAIGDWRPEPPLRLRTTGPELPWLREDAARVTRRASGVGTWELLLQQAQGRYLQLRITLSCREGQIAPRLRALRAWAPRFSYPQRFLPAAYREDAAAGNFLERWLANMESGLTEIEDRIAGVQTLFDPRSVPEALLAWLAGWFDLALDPAWDERRHRLLVRHAMDFFRWRGTVHGLRLALQLAFDPRFDPAQFDGPGADDDAGGRIRIVEAYQTRLYTALAAAAAPAAGAGPDAVLQTRTPNALWTPAEGNAGLWERYAAGLGRRATAREQLTPFPLVAPSDPAQAAAWTKCCDLHLGMRPEAGALERARWQAFLRTRYGRVEALNAAHAAQSSDFAAIALPRAPLPDGVARSDWRSFAARADGRRERGLWQDFLARRYRRIERLRAAWAADWAEFADVPLPDALPATAAAQTDWLQYERQLLAMHRSAHRFSVLLPVAGVEEDPYVLETRLGLARRIVALEKPAHTVFDVRFYWAFNRVGEARLGLDTQLGAGSRASELIPTAAIGRAYLGASFVGGDAPRRDGDRLSLDC